MKKNWLFITFLVTYTTILLYKVITFVTPFYDWDESLYVQTGREMLQHRYFLFPVWQGTPWLDKPPLIPLVYGIVAKLAFFTTPEVSTRVFTVLISVIVLTLLYILFQRASKDNLVATLGIAITALTPIFLQRSQVVNLDMFLLLGWVGYVIFFESFWASLLFLVLAILSKSLIGFYAPGLMMLYFGYLFVTKKISKKELIPHLKKIAIHVSVGLSWFVAMLAIFRGQFWKLHIIESHFRRVTSSIEFHFGQKTFYIDLAREQLGIFFWIGLIGLMIVLLKYFKKEKQLFFALYLLPWFVFLNLTKTKIFWYFYAAIPQFGFLAAAPALAVRRGKPLYYGVLIAVFGILIYQSFIQKNVLAKVYSKPEPYYNLSLYAKDHCDKMYILMDKQTRSSFEELDRLGLLITTTKWWGSHPSMVYYFEKPISFIYNRDEFIESSLRAKKNECTVIDSTDSDLTPNKTSFTGLNTFGSMKLFVRK